MSDRFDTGLKCSSLLAFLLFIIGYFRFTIKKAVKNIWHCSLDSFSDDFSSKRLVLGVTFERLTKTTLRMNGFYFIEIEASDPKTHTRQFN